MRFLMVDRIYELQRATHAKGIKNVSWDDDFLVELFPDIPVFSPIVAAECAAQLVSWVIVEARGFTVKPVITMVDSYLCSGHAMPGDQLMLEGTIESLSDESALVHARILLNGRSIVELEHAVCYLYPLPELDSPENARRQFENMFVPGHVPGCTNLASPVSMLRENIPLRTRPCVDRIIVPKEPGTLQGLRNVAATEDYFNDHFPRKPILPGVVMLESLVGLAGLLVERALRDQGLHDSMPVLQQCEKIKFRRFVQPGDQLAISARLTAFETESSKAHIQAAVNGKNAVALSVSFKHLDRNAYKHAYLAQQSERGDHD
jgi:3-hydroxyacyl-[acyl-carrier-protein] dehydratase